MNFFNNFIKSIKPLLKKHLDKDIRLLEIFRLNLVRKKN